MEKIYLGYINDMRSVVMRKIKLKNKNKWLIFIVIILIGVSLTCYIWSMRNNFVSESNEEVPEEKLTLQDIKNNYNDYVKLVNNSYIYIKDEEKYIEFSNIVGEIEVSLDANYEIIDGYFKIKDSDYYVKYDSVLKIDNLSALSREYKYYKNYIPYNENIILNDRSKLFVDEVNYYEVDGGSYPIIIKDNDRYGIEFNNRLVYVNKSDVKEVVSSNNTKEEITDGISVMNYHYVVSASNDNGELDECRQSICITDTMFDSHIKYLKDNGYYGVSMRDLELFIDGKIQLPKNSISITIDDGWYLARSIYILQKYQMLGTLFLIGSLASPTDYTSEFLEVHSHTWSMHGTNNGDDCPNSSFRGGITCLDRETILEDLRKSRESLGNTTYFCYPFYDYNDRAIELLKEAGFTMAFVGERRDSKVRVGTDKFKLPRYVITNQTSMNTFIRYVS